MSIALWIFGVIWLFGWIASIRSTCVSQESGWKMIGGALLLFFVWPYIALCMFNEGDI